MNSILEALTSIGVFLAGLAARVGIVVLVMLALLIPVMLVVTASRGFRAIGLWARGYRAAAGLRYRFGLWYAAGHSWLRPEGNRLRVGLDDLAQRLLPWAVAVELPSPGKKVKVGEPVARISSGGRQAVVAAPVSGTVVTVNPAVAEEPTLLKSDSYGRGWLFAVEPDDDSWQRLPTGEAARAWLGAESHRLARFYEQQLGFAAADGGELLAPPASLLGEAQWKALTQAFLGT
jgi:glycine cleavage system H lipoate-binding protein